MTTYTYEFTAFTEDALLSAGSGNGSNLGNGDSFTMPASADATFSVTDNDPYLSGDSRRNENSNDRSYQTATITVDGEEVGNGGQIYGEQYFWVWGSSGNWYMLLEIEQEGTNDDYFAFYNAYGMPEEGETLTVSCGGNISCWQPHMGCIESPPATTPPVAVLDAITITEGEAIGDNNDDAQLNILANDFDTDGTISLTGVNGAAPGDVITVTTDGGVSVDVTVDANGNLFFDTGSDFDNLLDGQSDSFELTYTITDNDGNLATSTVTVTIEGESGIDAVDDEYTVLETEGAGSIQGNVLENDSNDFGMVDAVLRVNGQEANVGEWIDLDGGGRVRLMENGDLDFDADGDFENLAEGEIAMQNLTYTIAQMGEGSNDEYQCLFFGGHSAGTIIDDEYEANGVTISSLNGSNPVMIFDTANPTGGDFDLASNSRGKVLILSEDGDTSDPDDNAGGGTFVFDFHREADVESLIFLDTEEPAPEIRLYNEAGDLITTIMGPVTTDGGEGYADINIDGVHRMEVEIQGSGAIDNLIYTLKGEQAVVEEDTANVKINIIGINDLEDGDEAATVEEGSGVTALATNALANAVDVDGGTPIVTTLDGTALNGGSAAADGSAGGVFTFDADGNVSFDTDGAFDYLGEGETAETSVTYQVADGQGGLVTSTYTVTVTGVANGNPPVAQDDAYITDEVTAVTGNVLDNDFDPDGDPISVVAVEGGMLGDPITVTTAKGNEGTVTLLSDGTFTFTPGESFIALTQDEQDSFQLTYTISDDPMTAQKTNLLFVLDVSNSTVGQDGENVFVGTGVGDVNGDGRADTVLDAEIAAVINAVNGLLAEGVNPDMVDVGIVTFSGLVDLTRFAAPFNTPTADAETVGTWQLDEAALIAALSNVASGGWTNYEAGLQEAEAWLAEHADAGEANNVYFLSDGRPIIDYQNGAYVTQTTSDYGDEVARIANDHNADIYAIGVGANSDLDYLNDIDNTGGAEQVLDSNALTVLLEELVVLPQTDTATITVTINGINDLSDEDEGASVDEGSGVTVLAVNALANAVDPDGGTPAVTPITLVAGDNGGLFSIAADGTVTFDTNDDFNTLGSGDSEVTKVTYTVTDGQGGVDTSVFTVTVNGVNNLEDGDETGAVDEDAGPTLLDNALANVVDNDSDPANIMIVALAGLPLMAGSATAEGSDGGSFTFLEDGTVTFSTDGDFDALEPGEMMTTSVFYDVTDGDATVTSEYVVTVTGVNDAPVAVANSYAINEGEALTGANIITDPDQSSDVGEADSDPNGDALVINSALGKDASGDMTVDIVSSTFVTVYTDGGVAVEVKLDDAGNLEVSENSEVDAAGDQISLTYTVEDIPANGDVKVSNEASVTVSIADIPDPSGPEINVVFVLDASDGAITANSATQAVGDLNGDLKFNSNFDLSIDVMQNAIANISSALGAGAHNIDIGVFSFESQLTSIANEFTPAVALAAGTETVFDLGTDFAQVIADVKTGTGVPFGDNGSDIFDNGAAFMAAAMEAANGFISANDQSGAGEEAINLVYVIGASLGADIGNDYVGAGGPGVPDGNPDGFSSIEYLEGLPDPVGQMFRNGNLDPNSDVALTNALLASEDLGVTLDTLYFGSDAVAPNSALFALENFQPDFFTLETVLADGTINTDATTFLNGVTTQFDDLLA